MAYNFEYPYVDAGRYNDDWLLNKMKELELKLEDLKAKSSCCGDPRKFGAKGDGVTDDTAAFIACASAYDNICITAGKYRITTILRFNNKSIVGYNATIMLDGSARVALTDSYMEGCSFENIGTSDGSFVSTSGEVSICRCRFKDSPGISVSIARGKCVVRECHFEGGNFGIWSDSQISPTDLLAVEDSYFTNTLLNAIFGFAKNVVVIGSLFEDCHTQVQPTGGGVLDVTASDSDLNYSNFVVIGCTITGGNSATSGIELEGGNVSVTNCKIATPNSQLALQNLNRAFISSCELTGGLTGIFAPGGGELYIVNNITGGKNFAIRINGECRGEITGNRLVEGELSFAGFTFNGGVANNWPPEFNFNAVCSQNIPGNFTTTAKNMYKLVYYSDTSGTVLTAYFNRDGLLEILHGEGLVGDQISIVNRAGHLQITVLKPNTYGKIHITEV